MIAHSRIRRCRRSSHNDNINDTCYNYHRNFVRFAVCFSLNHAAGLACLVLASSSNSASQSSQQQHQLPAARPIAVLYLCYTLTALVVAVPLTQHWGSHAASVVGLTLFSIYVLATYVSGVLLQRGGVTTSENDNPNIMVLYWMGTVLLPMVGAALGGVGAGVAWTAQGVYFAETVHRIQQQQQQQEQNIRMDAGVEEERPREESSLDGAQVNAALAAAIETPTTTAINITPQSLAATFAGTLLLAETLLDSLATIATEGSWHISWSVVYGFYATLAVGSTVVLYFGVWDYSTLSTASSCHHNNSNNEEEEEEEEDMNFLYETTTQAPSHLVRVQSSSSSSSWTNIAQQVTAVLRLWVTDPKLKYLLGFNASFAFAGAYLNSFVSGEVVLVVLQNYYDKNAKDDDDDDHSGSGWVGCLVAWHGIVAATVAWGLGKYGGTTGSSNNNNNKNRISEASLTVGALAFAAMALPFVWPGDGGYTTTWSPLMLVYIYAVQGVGRATFEGTLKALFANYFGWHNKEAAFANIILQYGLCSAAAYFVSTKLHCSTNSNTSMASDNYANDYCVEYRDGTYHNVWAFSWLVIGTSILAIVGILRASWIFHNEEASSGRIVCKDDEDNINNSNNQLCSPLTWMQDCPPNSLGQMRRHKFYQSVETETTAECELSSIT